MVIFPIIIVHFITLRALSYMCEFACAVRMGRNNFAKTLKILVKFILNCPLAYATIESARKLGLCEKLSGFGK